MLVRRVLVENGRDVRDRRGRQRWSECTSAGVGWHFQGGKGEQRSCERKKTLTKPPIIGERMEKTAQGVEGRLYQRPNSAAGRGMCRRAFA